MNIERIEDVIQNIKDHPDNYETTSRHCGNTHDFIGFANLMALGLPATSGERDVWEKTKKLNEKIVFGNSFYDRPIWDRVAKFLDLTPKQLSYFDKCTSFSEVQDYAKTLIYYHQLGE